MDLERIRQSTDLRDWYPEHLITQRWERFDNRWVSAHCCFHVDSHASAGVSRWGFHCFMGCGVIPDNKADIFKFVMYFHNIEGFVEAVKCIEGNSRPTDRFIPVQSPVARPIPPTYTPDDVERYVRAMEQDDYNYLTARTRIEEGTAAEHRVGTLPDWKDRLSH